MTRTDAGALADLPNVGPVLQRNLRAIGISTPDELRRVGSREAFARIRVTADPGACLHMLYGLEGAVRGIPDTQIPADERLALKRFFHDLDAVG